MKVSSSNRCPLDYTTLKKISCEQRIQDTTSTTILNNARYFMHGEDHAGISAFVNKSTDQWERNALMLAVGALVPLEQGRLGRSWKHASELKRIARYAMRLLFDIQD